MTTRVGVGRSKNRNPVVAGREAASAALEQLGGGRASVAMVFATAGYDQAALLRAIAEAVGETPIVGCSAEGVITQHGSEETSHAVAVTAIASDELVAETFFVPGFTEDAAACGRALVDAIRERDVRGRLLVLFPDGIQGNCTELIQAIEQAMPYPLPIVGGTAGDLLAFKQTYQYHRGEVASGGVSALLLGGEFVAELGVTHGCDLIGIERVVTRAEGGFVCEIDGRPAWSFFKEYLADDADTLEAVHLSHLLLAERLPANVPEFDEFTVRVPVQLDKERGALYFAAGIRSGTRVQLARRNPDKVCVRAVGEAHRLVDKHKGQRPLMVLELDCAGRGAMLFGSETNSRLIDPVQQVFGKDVPWVGLHTYGEIAPVGGRTLFHNYTAVLCALYPAT